MKAIVRTKYGSPDVLQLKEIETPTPSDDEVLVRIHASSLNAYDWHLLRAKPFLIRLMGQGLLTPKKPILGADIAGKVEAIGSNAKRFQVGDEVYGCISSCGDGGLAEYVCASENVLARKPAGLSFEQAAAVPMASLTALQGLRDIGRIRPGMKVLINGASGGVGTFAVQIAKSFGAEVTGICSTGNLEMVRAIGADHVVDYTREDFTRSGQQYDLILDVAANRTVADYNRALNDGGICAVVGFSTLFHMLHVLFTGKRMAKNGGKRIAMVSMKTDKEDLAFMNTLLASGKVSPVIDRRYPLREAPEAIRYLEQGHARGKIVITNP